MLDEYSIEQRATQILDAPSKESGRRNWGMAVNIGEQIGEQIAKSHCQFDLKSMTGGDDSVDASPIPKIPTLIGWDFFCPFPQCWRGFRAWPRERHPCEVGAFGPADASLFSVFSGGHASVLEAISFAGAGLEAVGCGWQLL